MGIGVARPDQTAEQLIARADAAAYRAKRDGKNKASFDSPEMRSPLTVVAR